VAEILTTLQAITWVAEL